MSAFDKVSGQYQRQALVQQAAAEKLLAMVNIRSNEDVLEVACGPGHITQRIKTMTNGRVAGADISAGMIVNARANYPALEFRNLAAESLDYRDEFDVVFCNSSFQWFKQPGKAVAAMRDALRPKDKLVVACPATDDWSLCFKAVAAEAGEHADLRATFARWKSPWFYLPDEQSYQQLFEGQGLKTIQCRIELEETQYDTEQAIAIFTSGAAQGFTGKEFYDAPN